MIWEWKRHLFSFRRLYVSLFRCNLTTRLVVPGPWRGAEHEEKGAGGFLQDEWEHWLPKPKFSQQTLQVCALPRLFVHIKPAAAHMSGPLFVPHSSPQTLIHACCLTFNLPASAAYLPSIWFLYCFSEYLCFNSCSKFFFWESVWRL